jgi:mannose-6-phosphate isomerase-like protein (cupin superfamily)
MKERTMIQDRLVRGADFVCVHAGPKDGWTQFRLEPPEVPFSARGKLFLQAMLESSGFEMSLNVIPPGKGIPFLHKHRDNDEIYVVIGGRGQFLVDDEVVDMEEGSVLRIRPSAARAWRNNGDAPLHFLCIQYRADSEIKGGTADGVRVEGTPNWPT